MEPTQTFPVTWPLLVGHVALATSLTCPHAAPEKQAAIVSGFAARRRMVHYSNLDTFPTIFNHPEEPVDLTPAQIGDILQEHFIKCPLVQELANPGGGTLPLKDENVMEAVGSPLLKSLPYLIRGVSGIDLDSLLRRAINNIIGYYRTQLYDERDVEWRHTLYQRRDPTKVIERIIELLTEANEWMAQVNGVTQASRSEAWGLLMYSASYSTVAAINGLQGILGLEPMYQATDRMEEALNFFAYNIYPEFPGSIDYGTMYRNQARRGLGMKDEEALPAAAEKP